MIIITAAIKISSIVSITGPAPSRNDEKVPDLRVKTYSPPGREIGSSCGEFTKHYYHYEIETEEEKEEFEKWKEKHLVRN